MLTRIHSILEVEGGLRKQLLKAGIGSAGLKGCNMLLGLAVAILLARTLGPEGYGIYTYAMTLVTLLAMPALMGIPTLVMREVARYQVQEQWGLMRGLLRQATQVVGISSLLFAVTAGFMACILVDRLTQEQLSTFIWALVLLPLLALSNLRGATLRGLRYVVQGQLPEMLLKPGLLFLFLASLILIRNTGTLSPSSAMAMNAIAALFAFLIGGLLLIRALPEQVRATPPAYATNAWRRSVLPLSLLAGMQIINGQTDIIMLGIFTTAEEVGIYRIAVQGAALVLVAAPVINTVMAPYISRLYTQKDFYRLSVMLKKSIKILLLCTAPLALVGIVFGEQILGAVFGIDYIGAHVPLALLCLGSLWTAATGSIVTLMNMTGNERDTASTMAIGVVLNIPLNMIAIPMLGMVGAAGATLLSMIVWRMLLARKVRKQLGVSFDIVSF